ncbi:uncharacterized protein LOC119431215 isoform X4 [Dermacentor silvarum]|uniref:uncharacterized protein LOC119431215 isoform X4 n=1 Tax=Dermacentor silvarum TaxID=543639 RepID=UPI00189BDA4A|nr:uncharacterized protein LOC119431215 isoform X4 [Dermacentor silvarum]XP_049513761.1 uncharacterized protein LOC119431215 isoform X4 [Dermacentor silvarum]
MPGHGQGRVHRFRDHVVAGVNWRPTRFVNEVPNSRVCGLCRMIPKRMVLLPCSHALCQSCHAASFEGGVGQCPLDQVQFEEPECFGYDFPIRTANSLKVYCWNEEHGCEFTGTMEALLRHYEMECTFHTVECLRCGERVLHQDLPMHHVTACSGDASSAVTENSPSEPAALTLQDLSSAQEDLKALLKDLFHDNLLPAVQSQMNELTEHARSQEARLARITSELRASEHKLKVEMVDIERSIISEVSRLRNSAPETSASSSLPSRSEKALMLRKLEHVANLSLSALGHLRQYAPHQGRSPVIAYCHSVLASGNEDLRLTSALSTSLWLSEALKNMRYVLTIENAEQIFKCEEKKRTFAELTLFHTRDTYFTIAVTNRTYNGSSCLALEIQFNGLLEESRFVPLNLNLNVQVLAANATEGRYMHSFVRRCFCASNLDSLKHIHRVFWMASDPLVNDGYLRDGKMTFDIELEEMKDARGEHEALFAALRGWQQRVLNAA